MKVIMTNDELYNINSFLHEFALSEFDVTQDNIHQVTYWLVERGTDA